MKSAQAERVHAGQTAGPVDLGPSPKDPYRQPKRGACPRRAEGGWRGGAGVDGGAAHYTLRLFP